MNDAVQTVCNELGIPRPKRTRLGRPRYNWYEDLLVHDEKLVSIYHEAIHKKRFLENKMVYKSAKWLHTVDNRNIILLYLPFHMCLVFVEELIVTFLSFKYTKGIVPLISLFLHIYIIVATVLIIRFFIFRIFIGV